MAKISLTNLITSPSNGSFETNITGWVGFQTNQSNAQSSVTPTRVAKPANPTHSEYGSWVLDHGAKTQGTVYVRPSSNISCTIGHKYYLRCQIRLRGSTAGAVTMGAILHGINPAGANIIPPGKGENLVPFVEGAMSTDTTGWERIDAIWDCDRASFLPSFTWRKSSSGNDDQYGQLDNVVLIDLTNDFGVGNEPALIAIRGAVDLYEPELPSTNGGHGYWDGTTLVEMPIPPVISTQSVKMGLKGFSYDELIEVQTQTGTTPFGFSLSGLPAGHGLSISSSGVISGTLGLSEGSYTLTVTLTDAVGYRVSQNYTLVVKEPPNIHDDYAPGAVTDIPYSWTPDVTGSDGNLTYSITVTSGTLPTGLSIVSGSIVGTPTVDNQSCQITVTAYNDYYPSGVTKVFTLDVSSAPTINTTSPLRNATLGVFYTQTFTAGGATPIDWEITTGSIPPGMSFSGNVLSGTPSQTGAYSFALRATNEHGSDNRIYLINVYELPVITTISFGNGRISIPYSAEVLASGTDPKTYAITVGSLPQGLSLSPSGVISGTPQALGISTFTIVATNVAGNSSPVQFQISIVGGLGITTPSPLRNGTLNVNYGSLQLTAVNVDSAFAATWSWAAQAGSQLPPGLSLNSNSGVISGTPSLAGTFSINITINNGASGSSTSPFVITIGTPPVITTPSPLGGNVDRPFTAVLNATSQGATTWAITAGPSPAAAISLSPSGVLSWTSPVEGEYIFTVVATNAFGASTPVVYTLIITTPGIKTTTLPIGIVGEVYEAFIIGSGEEPYTWTLTSGSLPAGLSFGSATILDPDSGDPTDAFRIFGIPTSVGTSNFTVKLQNIGGVDEEPFFITVYAKPIITTTTLDTSIVGVPYSQTLTATGTTPITWTLISGVGDTMPALPPGLFLVEDTISGTLVTQGPHTVYIFTIAASNITGIDDIKQLSIRVGPSGAPVITTLPALTATRGVPYSLSLVATGNATIVWTLDGLSTFPSGLGLSGNTISGTPSVAGVYNFTIRATNGQGFDLRQFTITIADPPTITTPTLPNGVIGQSYNQTISATGDPPITFTLRPLSGGETGLPNGVTLTGSTGVLSGTPNTPGTFIFTIRATNASGYNEVQYTIHITSQGGMGLDGRRVGGIGLDGRKVGAIALGGKVIYRKT